MNAARRIKSFVCRRKVFLAALAQHSERAGLLSTHSITGVGVQWRCDRGGGLGLISISKSSI